MFPCNILTRIYIDLEELYLSCLCLLLCERIEDWGDALARAAPIRVEVDNVVRSSGERGAEM
jgi:hypothetical protein